MNKETYKRTELVITEFGGEHILTYSGEGSGPTRSLSTPVYELPVAMPEVEYPNSF